MKTRDNKEMASVVVQDMPDKKTSNVWLRKNMTSGSDENGIYYEADELFIEVTSLSNLKEQIESDFESWWNFVEAKNNEPKEKTIPERLVETETKVVTIEETIDVLFGGV